MPGGLELALGSGLVHDVGIAQDGDVYAAPDGTAYTVAVHDGQCLGVPCDDSDCYEIINLPNDELVRYRLDLRRVGAEMQSGTGIRGDVQEVAPRALYLGEWRDDHGEVPVLLVMPPSRNACANMLMGLPLQLPGRHRRIVVALPANMPGETEVRRLNDAGIWPVELAQGDGIGIDLKCLLSADDGAKPTPVLIVESSRLRVCFHSEWVTLTQAEVLTVEVFARHAGKTLSNSCVAEATRGVGGDDQMDQVPKQIWSVRKKLGAVASRDGRFTHEDAARLFETVRSTGYRLDLDPALVELKA